MPSSLGHASVAVLASPMIWRRPGAQRLVIVAALLAVMPDIDAIGRPFGFGDIAFLGGHRAVTHSVFAALIAGLSVAFAWRSRAATGPTMLAIFLYVTMVVIAHGVLDTMATYGDGVAFLAPFSAARYSAPWQPFTGIVFEIAVLWAPAALMLAYIRRAGLFGESNRSLQHPTRGVAADAAQNPRPRTPQSTFHSMPRSSPTSAEASAAAVPNRTRHPGR